MIKIKHKPPVMSPMALAILLAVLFAVTSGPVLAQGPGDGFTAVAAPAVQRGGFLRPGDSLDGYFSASDVPYMNITPDGYIIYFGNRADIALYRAYTVAVHGELANPKILISLYDDTAQLAQYANHFGTTPAAFAQALGLPSERDPVELLPVGTFVAQNVRGVDSVTFLPIPGDIGAYLIEVSSYEDGEHGSYTISIIS